MNLRGTIISYASRRKKGMIDKEKKIEEKINELERSNVCTNNVHNNLVTLKEELYEIRKQNMKGVIIEQDKSSDIEQQPPFGDHKISNIQPQNRGGSKPTGTSYNFDKV